MKRLQASRSKFTDDELVDAMLFFGNYIENELVIPGKAEGIDLLLDLSDLGVSDIPVGLLRKAASIASLAFTARTHKIFVMNSTWFIMKICNVLYSMTPEFTALKIKIVD